MLLLHFESARAVRAPKCCGRSGTSSSNQQVKCTLAISSALPELQRMRLGTAQRMLSDSFWCQCSFLLQFAKRLPQNLDRRCKE
jgi:hypothetical protein